MLREIDSCSLLNQNTRLFPKKNAPPLVLFLSSRLPTQYAYVYSIRVKPFFAGYHKPISKILFRYMKIVFTTCTYDSFG